MVMTGTDTQTPTRATPSHKEKVTNTAAGETVTLCALPHPTASRGKAVQRIGRHDGQQRGQCVGDIVIAGEGECVTRHQRLNIRGVCEPNLFGEAHRNHQFARRAGQRIGDNPAVNTRVPDDIGRIQQNSVHGFLGVANRFARFGRNQAVYAASGQHAGMSGRPGQ